MSAYGMGPEISLLTENMWSKAEETAHESFDVHIPVVAKYPTQTDDARSPESLNAHTIAAGKCSHVR